METLWDKSQSSQNNPAKKKLKDELSFLFMNKDPDFKRPLICDSINLQWAPCYEMPFFSIILIFWALRKSVNTFNHVTLTLLGTERYLWVPK